MEFIGLLLALLVGISLGLMGSGGSILTVPILVYVIGINPVLATGHSLFIVGTTALVGSIHNIIQKNVDFKTTFIFGIPSIITIYITRLWLFPIIPEVLFSIGAFTVTKSIALMLLFAIVMILASLSMIILDENEMNENKATIKYNYTLILTQGIFVGLLSGLVGVGGGFLIIPALVILARIPMKMAVGSSLIIISANSLIGFIGDLQTNHIFYWLLLIKFTSSAIAGMFIGILLSKKISGKKLKTAFGWFILIMALYIIVKETIIK